MQAQAKRETQIVVGSVVKKIIFAKYCMNWTSAEKIGYT